MCKLVGGLISDVGKRPGLSPVFPSPGFFRPGSFPIDKSGVAVQNSALLGGSRFLPLLSLSKS
jgi:hypothetical protein